MLLSQIMVLFRQQKRFISCLALVAMLLNLFAPTIAHAFSKVSGKPQPWMQICSVSGIQYIPLALNLIANNDSDYTAADSIYFSSTAKQSNPDNSNMPMQHCAYCLSHAHHAAVFIQQNLTVFDRHFTQEFPPLFYQSHAPLFAWVVANPRAPPISC